MGWWIERRVKDMLGITKRFVGLFMAVSFMVLLFAGHATTTGVKRGGTITVGVDAGPPGFDPFKTVGAPSWNHVELVYENLVRFNHKMEIEPCLAESWEQPDRLTYVFHLRKGVRFHNGREMVADDVKYSTDRARNPKTAARPGMFEAIKSVDVLDKYTVKFNLSSPDTVLLPVIAYGRHSAIVPREHGDLKTLACGTGPFKMKKFVPGDYTVYERNPDYWEKGLPRLDRVIYKVIKDETSRVAALRRGAVDIGWVKEIPLAKQLQKEEALRVIMTAPARITRLILRLDRFPFNNKKLRQAVSATIDRKAFIDTVLMGFGELTSFIPPSTAPIALPQEEIVKLPFYKRDLELSKRLLREAGYPNGFEFTIVSSAHSPDYMAGAQMIQSFCKDVGIKVKIQQAEWGIHLKKWKTGDFQALILGSSWYPAPEEYARKDVHSRSRTNYSKYKNPEVDKLLDESRITHDKRRRMEIWRKLQYIIAEDIPQIYCAAGPLRNEVVRDYVRGYYFLPNTSRAYLREAWLDK